MHRSTEARPDGQVTRRTSAELVPGSIASLDETLPPTSTAKLLEAGGASVYVLSKDPELVAAFTIAGGERVTVNVIWSFRELRRQVESGDCKIVLLDADLFEGSLRTWIEDLRAIEPSLVTLVAAPRSAADGVMELLSERLVHRLLIKPAAIGITRILLEAVISRYMQVREEAAAARDSLEAAREQNSAEQGEAAGIHVDMDAATPRHELLALRDALAEVMPIRAPQRRPIAPSPTRWPAWFLAVALVATLVVGAFVDDFSLLERLGTSGSSARAPSRPSYAEPVEAEVAATDDVAGRAEAAFVADSPAANGPVPAEPEPVAEPSAERSASSSPVVIAPPAPERGVVGPPAPEPERGVVGPLVPERALVGPPAPEPAVVGSPAPAPAARPRAPLELESLLATAWMRVRQNRLLDPPGDSARDYVARAVALAPGHPDVAAMRLTLGEAVAESARVALESGDIENAETLAGEAFRLGASPETLAVLDLDLAAAREVGARRTYSDLLALGVARLHADRLVAPENDSALYYLRRLRGENPSYPGLDSAWQRLGEALMRKAEESGAAGDWPGAEAWLGHLAVVASPATIERARAELDAERIQAEYLATPAPAGELRLLRPVEPVYPEGALRRGIAGWVDVELIVGTNGIPHEARVVAADPPGTFEQAALAAVSLYRYEPFERDGRAYERLARLRIRFDLRSR